MTKVVATIGLLFFAYCLVRVVTAWNARTEIEKGIWFLIIVGGACWCLSAFG